MIGSIATYSNVKNTRGPKERSFVIRISAASWLLVMSMLLFVYYIPSPYRYWILAAYFIACPILIYNWSTTHQLIRLVEERDREEDEAKKTAY